ncbi:hypothetical protein KIK06_17365 [Nocardiopsis sp. EMB25]|uniref:hypothetical protein n=1 Tax=Nocardiopsis sp. EMB25 TaxID=2835867 RepID=UPI002283D91C|nr:hypothetical protein [Nocardiopsis sp. EMB25]MCY9785657.1 hypothetical protein [Nocardiopsis sp. EMB25]
MEFTLADGTTVRITAATSRALRAAVPVQGRPGLSRLRSRTPGEAVRALADQRLAVRDRRLGIWVLTERGAGVRDLLANAPGTAFGGGGDDWGGHEPTRLTVHPEVDDGTAVRLNAAALRRDRPAPQPRPPLPYRRSDASLPDKDHWLYPVGGAVIVGLFLLLLPFLGIVAAGVLVFLGLGAAGVAALATVITKAFDEPSRRPLPGQAERATEEWLLREWREWYVSPDTLDTPARALLGRAQAAVDSVLASSLHDQGLLLDTVRNRVVLADVEWGLARSLAGHTRTRRTMASTPTPGEHSRRAAARAREVLDQDVARVAERVRVLEDYANKVRAAEMERYDRRAAERLEALALEAGSDHRQQDEALSTLVQAQELALRVASLTNELGYPGHPGPLDGPEPPDGPRR